MRRPLSHRLRIRVGSPAERPDASVRGRARIKFDHGRLSAAWDGLRPATRPTASCRFEVRCPGDPPQSGSHRPPSPDRRPGALAKLRDDRGRSTSPDFWDGSCVPEVWAVGTPIRGHGSLALAARNASREVKIEAEDLRETGNLHDCRWFEVSRRDSPAKFRERTQLLFKLHRRVISLVRVLGARQD